MKKVKLVLGLVFIGFLASCNTQETAQDTATTAEETHELAHAHYTCPMQCEGDKQYEEPGTCPVCKMDLEEVGLSEEEVAH
jgi:transcription initiation factor IIE alpha subunit